VSVIVQITDSCPECEPDHIDIQALTYNKLSPMSTGRISIQYRRVECVPPQKIVISVDNSAGPGGWLRLFVEARPAACARPGACRGRLPARTAALRAPRGRLAGTRVREQAGCVGGQGCAQALAGAAPGGQQALTVSQPGPSRGARADARRGARRARAVWRR